MAPYKGGGQSLREKSLVKRRISKEHNSNFRAGYVHINEDRLHRTGIRGRKSWIFIALIILMFIVTVANMIVTIVILSVLKINNHGIQSLEFIPDEMVLKFLHSTVFGSMLLHSSLTSFQNTDIEISATNEKVILQHSEANSSWIHISEKNISVSSDSFNIVSSTSGQSMFSTESNIKLLEPISSLQSSQITVPRIAARLDRSLVISSDVNISMSGAEGIDINSRSLLLQARDGIFLESRGNSFFGSENSRIELDGKSGIHLDVQKLPILTPGVSGRTLYKLCACMPSGKLYLINSNLPYVTCAHRDDSLNPCE